MMSNKSTNKIVIFNVLSTIILQGTTLVVMPFISRALGTNNYGILSIYATWASLFSSVFSLQVHSSIAVSRRDFSEEKQLKYQSSILFLALLAFLTFALVSLSILPFLADWLGLTKVLLLILIFYVFGEIMVSFITTKFTYEFKAKYNFILTCVLSFSTTLLSFLLLRCFNKEINYYARVLGLSIPYFLIGIVVSILVFCKGKCFFSKEYWKYCLVLSLPIIFHSVSSIVLNQSDKIMLQRFLSSSDVGIYGLAFSFASVVTVIWSALNNSYVPFFYDYEKDKKFDSVKALNEKYVEVFTIVVSGFLLLTNFVYKIYADESFHYGLKYIPFFVLSSYMTFVYSFSVNYEFFCKKTKTIAFATIITGLVNIALNFILIPLCGQIGAAIATLASHVLLALFHHFFCLHISKRNEFPYFHISKKSYLWVVVIIISIVVYYLSPTQIINWVLAVSLGVFEMVRIIRRKSIF